MSWFIPLVAFSPKVVALAGAGAYFFTNEWFRKEYEVDFETETNRPVADTPPLPPPADPSKPHVEVISHPPMYFAYSPTFLSSQYTVASISNDETIYLRYDVDFRKKNQLLSLVDFKGKKIPFVTTFDPAETYVMSQQASAYPFGVYRILYERDNDVKNTTEYYWGPELIVGGAKALIKTSQVSVSTNGHLRIVVQTRGLKVNEKITLLWPLRTSNWTNIESHWGNQTKQVDAQGMAFFDVPIDETTKEGYVDFWVRYKGEKIAEKKVHVNLYLDLQEMLFYGGMIVISTAAISLSASIALYAYNIANNASTASMERTAAQFQGPPREEEFEVVRRVKRQAVVQAKKEEVKKEEEAQSGDETTEELDIEDWGIPHRYSRRVRSKK